MARARQVVVALDQGSSSSRALAIDARGRVVARAQHKVRSAYPRAGWSEHDALDLARTVERALDEVLASLPERDEVLGVGLACQRSTIVFWDAETGKPVCPAPSWQDGRAAALVAPLQAHQARAHETTGLYLTPYYSAPKIRWTLDHVPAARALAEKGRLRIGPVSTWLYWRLTGGKVFAADPTTAQRTMLFSLRTCDWDPFMLELFGVPRAALPEIRPSSGDWGQVKRGGRTLALRAVVGDQQAAALGLGGRAPGSAIANYGTGAFFLLNTGSAQHRIPGLLTSIGATSAAREPYFLQEGTVHAAGASFDWLRDQLGLLDGAGDLDGACRRSKERVFSLNAIGGLGAPRWDYVTKTAFFGLSSRTTPDDLVRAVAEGVAFLIADIVAALRAGGLSFSEARVSGGLSRSAYLMQFQADLLGTPLSRCGESEATALGAAALAAEAAGADWTAALTRPRLDKTFEPKLERQQAERLLRQWSAFVGAQARLSRELTAA